MQRQSDKVLQQTTELNNCVDHIIQTVGRNIVLALPLGLGKANHVANALFLRATEDPDISLHIVTALTLEAPAAGNDLVQRFLQPVIERLYSHYPELLYAVARRQGKLPDNIKVSEFFLNPGSLLGNEVAQQNYLSSNYTHVCRDILDLGANVIAQLVSPNPEDKPLFSLSCNPDLTEELINRAQEKEQTIFKVAQINSQLPYMTGSAEVPCDFFDHIVDTTPDFPLFPTPLAPVALSDYAIATHVTSMIKDGGTLQIGIGSVGDSIAYLLALRHHKPELYQTLLSRLSEHHSQTLRANIPHETSPFAQGLYANTEMLVEGLIFLRQQDILKRKVAPGGQYCHAGFYLGSLNFYQQLRELDSESRNGLDMCPVSFTNHLYGDEHLKREQRRHARYINSGMMVTLTGAVISDAINDYQVVGGVGGQYNFVAQAQELEDGRSIICLHSTRTKNGKTSSNIVWDYPHATIPKHLRDIIVTEYGAADLRGLSDRDVIVQTLNIADSRFQDELMSAAKSAGKLESDYRIPEAFTHNYPDTITEAFEESGLAPNFPHFPLGSDFNQEEMRISVALVAIKQEGASPKQLLPFILSGWRHRKSGRKRYAAELHRMQLDQTRTPKDLFLQLLVIGALQKTESSRPLQFLL
ncbi:acetyl-CoA hydrolase/transferase C-terminal domain-containing protein [Pseudomaricurvus sp.]|uniref:acetyl-CoA hydrolase/transferase C-terminal domain-containing protein n=1 Tax=Pseudomaricurvus sp. TaxID=2004510 RepID=UPI003F6B529A